MPSRPTAPGPPGTGAPVPGAGISVTRLTLRHGSTVAVDDLTLQASRGALTVIVGPNGAGKTSTVECCEGYRRPDSGQVRVLGLDPVADGATLRPQVGVMLQEGAGLHQSAPAGALLRHLSRLYADPWDPDALLAELGLHEVRRRTVRQLSGGERARLALACALVGRPRVLFADEPTAGLDPRARQACWELLESLRDGGTTVLVTTHQIEQAERVADHVVVIDRGAVRAAGSPAELTAGPGTITFGARTGLPLSGLRGALPEHVQVTEPSPGRYRVTATTVDPALVATVTTWCAQHDVLAGDLRIGQRSLEDVVLDVTGTGR